MAALVASISNVFLLFDLKDVYFLLLLVLLARQYYGIVPRHGASTYVFTRLGMGSSVSPAVWPWSHPLHTHAHTHTHAHSHTRTHTCSHTRTHTHTCTLTHMHTCTLTHTHTRTHTHTHTRGGSGDVRGSFQ